MGIGQESNSLPKGVPDIVTIPASGSEKDPAGYGKNDTMGRSGPLPGSPDTETAKSMGVTPGSLAGLPSPPINVGDKMGYIDQGLMP